MIANSVFAQKNKEEVILAHWRFEQVQHLDGSLTPSVVGEPLTADDRQPSEPQPYGHDDSGNGNLLQVQGSRPSPNVCSDDVPFTQIDGKPNERSLTIKRATNMVSFDRPLPFLDLQKSWTIEASLKANLLGTEQVFLCKEGKRGQLVADVAIGFDNMHQQYFVEVLAQNEQSYRLVAGPVVEAGKWYDVKAHAQYDENANKTKVSLEVRASSQKKFSKAESIQFAGSVLRRDAGTWVIGRGYPGGFPNSLAVLDGGIDEIKISGASLPRALGQNPIFTDAFTADPAALVDRDRVYVYVGHDTANPGGWFNMPEWLCYSSTDMKNWTVHGPVLAPKDFETANHHAAWAAQVVEKDGKYYFYVTLDRQDGHFITVAVGDSPTGPFKEAMPGKPLVTDAMTTDSHRPNSDIDPTVFIDDATPWLFWGNGDCYRVKLKPNMIETDGAIEKVPYRSFSEGPWVFKRGDLYYNIYAADAPGVQSEQIAYSSAPSINGPWTYHGILTASANHGFTIHPSVIEFKDQWYFFYHDGSNSLDGKAGGFSRRSVCVEYLFFNEDGTIQPITQTSKGISMQLD